MTVFCWRCRCAVRCRIDGPLLFTDFGPVIDDFGDNVRCELRQFDVVCDITDYDEQVRRHVITYVLGVEWDCQFVWHVCMLQLNTDCVRGLPSSGYGRTVRCSWDTDVVVQRVGECDWTEQQRDVVHISSNYRAWVRAGASVAGYTWRRLVCNCRCGVCALVERFVDYLCDGGACRCFTVGAGTNLGTCAQTTASLASGSLSFPLQLLQCNSTTIVARSTAGYGTGLQVVVQVQSQTATSGQTFSYAAPSISGLVRECRGWF